MRTLTLAATALAFSVGATSFAHACPSMKSAGYEREQVVATDKAPKAPSTPIIIPEKPKAEG